MNPFRRRGLIGLLISITIVTMILISLQTPNDASDNNKVIQESKQTQEQSNVQAQDQSNQQKTENTDNALSLCFKGETERPVAEFSNDENVGMVFKVQKKLEDQHSPFQRIRVFDHQFFGRILFIDDSLQLTEKDQYNYHELFAHVPLQYNHKAESILILGAGDGGLLTQILKYPNVKRVVQVEIDKVVVAMTRRYFPVIAKSFESEKLQLIHEPGGEWVNKQAKLASPEKFDAVFIDGTDFFSQTRVKFPLNGKPFWKQIKTLMKKNSTLTMNADSPSWAMEDIIDITEEVQEFFTNVNVFNGFVPTFPSGHYAYIFCADHYHVIHSKINWTEYESYDMRNKYYDRDIHYSSFVLPLALREQLDQPLYLPEFEESGTDSDSDSEDDTDDEEEPTDARPKKSTHTTPENSENSRKPKNSKRKSADTRSKKSTHTTPENSRKPKKSKRKSHKRTKRRRRKKEKK